MIRINLLAVERAADQEGRGVVIPPAHRVTIGASLILIATVLGIGWWFCRCAQPSAQLDEDIADGRDRDAQLRSVLAQVQKFEARKAQLHAARHAHRAAAARPVGAGARPRRDQQEPARSAVADRGEADRAASSRSSGFAASLPSVVGFRRQPRSDASGSSGRSRSSTARCRPTPKTGDLVRFSIKGALNDPEAPPPPRRRAGRRLDEAVAAAKPAAK